MNETRPSTPELETYNVRRDLKMSHDTSINKNGGKQRNSFLSTDKEIYFRIAYTTLHEYFVKKELQLKILITQMNMFVLLLSMNKVEFFTT